MLISTDINLYLKVMAKKIGIEIIKKEKILITKILVLKMIFKQALILIEITTINLVMIMKVVLVILVMIFTEEVMLFLNQKQKQ